MGALDGQLALVTGASRGIGAATAAALAADGAHVVLVARDSDKLEEVEDAIHSAGGSATIAPLDLIEEQSVARLAQAIGDRWQGLDILVLNAGTLGTLTPVPQLDPAEFARTLTLNVSANQALIAGFDRMMRAAADARVLAVTSSLGTRPRAFWGGYAASKAAMEQLVLCYAEEVRRFGIRVAVVDPGATRTAMRANAFPGEDPAEVKDPAVVGEAIARLAASGWETGHRVRVEAEGLSRVTALDWQTVCSGSKWWKAD